MLFRKVFSNDMQQIENLNAIVLYYYWGIGMSTGDEKRQKEWRKEMAKENPYLDFDWSTGELKPSRFAERERERIKKELRRGSDRP